MPLCHLLSPRSLAVLALVLCSTGTSVAAAAKRPLEFNRDIRPILSNNCFLCHGPDAKKREAGLRLDDPAAATAVLESGGHAITPGSPETSEILARMVSTDPAVQMPPPGSGKSVTPDQIEIIRRWIREGAGYQGHWSFISPQRASAPTVTHTDAVRTPIDNFIIQRLEQAGLSPSPEADKVTLIRRLTLDLTGLPPTPAEVQAFMDDASPGAYERLVDRLLDSPRFGEHQARYWLDAARFGDTHGLHLDNERSMWPYREWVINAFNDNMPFDQFTIEQLAGDLLPNPTRDQLVASGFNRCNVTTSEGGSIDAEVLVRYAVDRTDAMGTVWMGLTLGCAVCHSHKFDPISQQEFYSLYSFFYSLADNAMDGNALLPAPIIKLPTAEQQQQLDQLAATISRSQQAIDQLLDRTQYIDPAQSEQAADALAVVRSDYVWFEDQLPEGANPQQAGHPWEFVTREQGPVFAGERSTVRSGDGVVQHFFTGAKTPLKLGTGDTLFTMVYLDPANPPKAVMLQFNDGSWEHRAIWGEDAIDWGQAGTTSRWRMGDLPATGQWVRLEVPIEKVGLPAGALLNGIAFTQLGGKAYWDHAGVHTLTPQGLPKFLSQTDWEVAERAAPSNAIPGDIQNLIKLAAEQRNADQQKQLRRYFLRYVYPPLQAELQPLNTELETATRQRSELDGMVAATLISADLPTPRDAFVLTRGAYDKPAEKVARGVPAVFPALPEGAPVNRLGLAKWLVHPSHPLTARVTVNRYWQQLFGTGIVKTSEDFGAQGQWPTHPELLDWLATEFISTGWNIKSLFKTMVMSGTYRQSSHVPPELAARDPQNELLARGPRFRLDAETLRDSALYVSGLLVERKGGKSVRTYQPEGIWESVAFVSSNTREYRRDNGDALYRRSLYTFWKRTSPPPSLQTFDAPSRENCTVRRPRTNTPLQALCLMNDEQYVEAARNLAVRMIADGGDSVDGRIQAGFLWMLGRKPTDRELAVVRRVYETQKSTFAADRDSAEKLLQVGLSGRPGALDPADHAAWTMIANLLMNLDEAVTKE